MTQTAPNRQIAIDIEATGVDPDKGHRVIEIAAVELVDRKLTGRSYRTFINPQREIEPGAQAVHGISIEQLENEPLFGDIASELIEFIKGADLIFHNEGVPNFV